MKDVWLSSVGHLERFRAIIGRTSTDERRRVVYHIPEGCPYTQPLWMVAPNIRAPLLFLTLGPIDLEGEELRFRAQPRNPFGVLGGRWANLLTDFSLTVPWREVIAVETHHFCSPVSAQWDVAFTRVRTAQLGLAGDFLLAAGLRVFGLQTLAQRRQELAERLSECFERKGWHANAHAAGA
jgi:hypothetical protein